MDHRQLLQQLLEACSRGNESTVEGILDRGLPVDSRDSDENTALQMAAANGQERVVRLLLMKGAALDVQNTFGWTALMQAARYGHFNVVSLLLQNNADIHARNRLNSSALTVAARGGHLQTVRYLVENGVDMNSSGTWCEFTPLMAAAQYGHDTIVRFLSDRGSDVNYRTPSAGLNALMLAALNGHVTTVQTLVESGADVNLTNASDWTALDIATATRNRKDLVAYLERKTTKRRKTEPEEVKLDIIEAATNGDMERMKEILEADITQRDACSHNGATPLMFAAMNGRLDMAQLLVEKGCDINRQDMISSWTALMQATYHGKKNVAKYLITIGADVTIQAKNRCTAFDLAYLIDDVDTELLRILASKVMPVKGQDKPKSGWTTSKHPKNGNTNSTSTEIIENQPKSGLKAWWSRMSNRFRYLKLGKTFTMQTNRLTPSAAASDDDQVTLTKSTKISARDIEGINTTPVEELTTETKSSLKSSNSYEKVNFEQAKETTPVFTLDMNTTMNSSLMSDTLKPVIPPFHPLPSFDLTESSRKMPGALRKGPSGCRDDSSLGQRTAVRPLKFIGTNTSPSNSNNYNNSSPGSSGGASSLTARTLPTNIHSEPYRKKSISSSYPLSTYSEPIHSTNQQPSIRPQHHNYLTHQLRMSRLTTRSSLTTSPNGSTSGSSSITPRIHSRAHHSSIGSTASTLTPSPSPTPKATEDSVLLESVENSTEQTDDDLGGILKQLSLEKYQPIFEEQEVDMEAFLTLTDNDLKELGISKREPRKQILSAINELSSKKARDRQHFNDTMTTFQNTLSSQTLSNRYSTGSDLTQWDIQEEDIIHLST